MEADGLVSQAAGRQGARGAREEGLLRRSRRAGQVGRHDVEDRRCRSARSPGASRLRRPRRQPSRRRRLYTRALDRERTLRDSAQKPALKQLRAAVASYEAIVRRYPASGYSDNALWQAANLALLAYDEYGEAADKQTGAPPARPSCAANTRPARSSPAPPRSSPCASATPPRPPAVPPPRPRPGRRQPPAETTPGPGTSPSIAGRPSNLGASTSTQHRTSADARCTPNVAQQHSAPESVAIRDVKRTELPDGVRVTIELDGEATYRSERLENPQRVFFDLKGAAPSAALMDATLKFDDDLVARSAIGPSSGATRIVMDMEGAESYSVFTLYEPFRLVVDFKRAAAGAPTPLPPPVRPPNRHAMRPCLAAAAARDVCAEADARAAGRSARWRRERPSAGAVGRRLRRRPRRPMPTASSRWRGSSGSASRGS